MIDYPPIEDRERTADELRALIDTWEHGIRQAQARLPKAEDLFDRARIIEGIQLLEQALNEMRDELYNTWRHP